MTTLSQTIQITRSGSQPPTKGPAEYFTPLNTLNAYLEVARRCSFAAAARELGVSPSALSQSSASSKRDLVRRS